MKTFEQFRRELEVDMMHALNASPPTKIGSVGDGCRCPLGIRTGSRFPGYEVASAEWGIDADCVESFADGFDGANTRDPDSRYYKLGVLYRARFGGE